MAAQGVGGFEYYGITHVSWWFDEYGYTGATASRQDMAATNANWGGVLVTWYQPGLRPTVLLRADANSNRRRDANGDSRDARHRHESDAEASRRYQRWTLARRHQSWG